MSSKTDYDVIIIGAGIGGLAAGAILAKNGKKVLILEKNPNVGGCATFFKRGDFKFDVALHMINGCGEGQLTYKILEKCGIINSVHFLFPDPIYRSIFPDFDFCVPQTNISEFASTLNKYFPNENEGIKDIFKEMGKVYAEVKKLLYSKIPRSIDLLLSLFKYPKLLIYSFQTYEDMLNKYIKDYKLKALLSQFWLFYGLPPSRLSSIFAAYANFDYLNNGGAYIEGGSEALFNALVEKIFSNNGKIILNVKVKKIMIKKRIAVSVLTDNDNFIGNYIISCMDIRKTFLELIGREKLNVGFLNRLMKYKASLSAFVVYLGLNVDLRQKGIKGYEIFYNTGYDLDSQYSACVAGELKRAPFMLTIYSNIDDSVCSKGKSLISISIESNYDSWFNLTRENYLQKKRELADILIKRSEKIIPQLSSYIETLEIATPLTIERYTANYKGAIFGWSQIVKQSGILRQSSKTPFKNLFLASAWTQPGGGMSPAMISGEHVAREILKRK
jgi:prolycopene isomerase